MLERRSEFQSRLGCTGLGRIHLLLVYVLGDSILRWGRGEDGEMGIDPGTGGTVAEDMASFDVNGIDTDLKMLTQYRQLNLPSPTTHKPA